MRPFFRLVRRVASWHFGPVLLALLLAAAGTSCSKKVPQEDRKPVHPVRGQVLVNDKPAVGAEVFLIPVDEPPEPKDPRPRATVDRNGNFALSTYEDKDGAPAGEYFVTIKWPGRVLPDGREEPEDKLMGRYADPAASKLRVMVKEGPNELAPFKLK